MRINCHIFLIGLFILCSKNSQCQIQLDNWFLTATVGFEKHDKRLFEYPERASLLRNQTENWGSQIYSLRIYRKFVSKNKLFITGGVGIQQELASFKRPFDRSSFKQDSFLILLNLDSYETFYGIISLQSLYFISENSFINIDMNLGTALYKKIDGTFSSSALFSPYSQTLFQLDHFNAIIGINFRIKKLLIGASMRAFNAQRIDKIIFNKIIKDPRIDQKIEYYNLLNINFSVSYNL